MIRIFIGFTRVEPVEYNVLQHSINRRSTSPVAFTPLNLDHLKDVFHREQHPLQTTEFSFSRFLVPYLCNYEGWAIFMDNDMLVLDDITNLWNLRDDKYAVMCVHHNHVPKSTTKLMDQPQTFYEKKNWSSVMLFNCKKCKSLTPEYVNNASGLELHRFKWLESEDLIGEIPLKWNYLVDYNETIPSNQISNLHYTEGGPYYEGYENCSYAKEWNDEKDDMLVVRKKKLTK